MDKSPDEKISELPIAANIKMEVDKDTIDPLEVNKHPKVIKEAQAELGKLDILVCGQCHMVFHFVEQFQEHRLLGNCSGMSSIRENNINESKAQVWAFLLWKGSQNLDESENSWVVYQRWCKMDSHLKETWVTAGRNVQVFTKLSAAKMQEVRAKVQQISKREDDLLEEGEIKRPSKQTKKGRQGELDEPLGDSDDPLDTDSELDTEEEAEREAELEKIKNSQKKNGTTEEDGKDKNDEKKNSGGTVALVKKVQVPLDKGSRLAKRTDRINNTEKEVVIEKILAKRFNPRRKLHEYLIKWEGYPNEQNTWEPAVHLEKCKYLLEAFERNLARQKEQKAAAAAAQAQLAKQQRANQKVAQPGTSGVLNTPGGRPQRTSKQKALNQVKAWCGNISDRDSLHPSSDSEDDPDNKRIKLEFDSGSEDEWTGEAPEPERTGLPGRPRILSKSASTVNGVAKRMTASEVAKSIGLASPDRPNSPQLVNAKGVVKVYPRQQNLPSGVYMVNRKDSLVTSSGQTTSIVRVVQKSANSTQNVVRVTPKSNTQVRILQKTEPNSNIIRVSPGMTKTGVPPLKQTPRPSIRVLQSGPQKLTAQRMTIGTPQLKVVGRGRTTAVKTTVYDAPETHEKDTESSEDDYDPFPTDLPPPEPDSPPREFTLDPMTGLILGQAEGEPEPQLQEPATQLPSLLPVKNETDTLPNLTTETMLPDSTAMDQTQAIKQEQEVLHHEGGLEHMEQGEQQTIGMETAEGEPLMITGEDGVVYRVAGQNEEGQTLLVAQTVDGEQQCVYVTASVDPSVDESQPAVSEAPSVLTLDGAVAEAVDGSTEHTEPLTVDTGEMVQEEDQSQVVAQLVKAEQPSPGGTRKVVLLLPDGNLLMTEVDAEQYEALELDK